MDELQDYVIPFLRERSFQGIPMIDASKLSYVTWHLLNEALSCFLNHEYFASLASLSSCIEDYLKKELGIDKRLNSLIKLAESCGLINKEEADSFHRIRKWRNTYIHQIDRELPRAEKARTVKWDENMAPIGITEAIDAYGWEVDPIPTKMRSDVTSMGVLSFIAYGGLNVMIRFLQEHYPLKPPYIYPYFQCDLVKIDGSDYGKEVFFFGLLQREKNLKTRIAGWLIRALGYHQLPRWGPPSFYPFFRMREYNEKDKIHS